MTNSFFGDDLDAYSNFSLRKNLAHLVEQLSVKQCVVGSSPTIFSFVSSLYGWVAQQVVAED